jgi:transposase
LSRVELFERIRRDKRLDPGLSHRELARRHGVHRRTVRLALGRAVPPERRKPVKTRALLLEPVTDQIDAMLRADLTAPRKQRHTIQRIYDRLLVEYDFNLACYSTVANYVNKRRPLIIAEAREGHQHLEGTVPQLHGPAAEAEVDFAEVWVRLAGEPVHCHLFTLRLSYSGKAVHRVFASQSQEAFMQGHAEAFRVLGGVPTRHIRYDNLKPAVNKVCFGRNRIESQRWTAFRSHYGFDAFYCIPGQEGAHEKGGVEHEGGRFRRNHLVPVVAVDTLTELNERLAEIDKAEDDRHIQGANTSIGFNFAAEADLLAPLPDDEFDCGIIGTQIRISLRANDLVVFDRNRVVARHERLTHRYHYRDNLDHYLEILKIKPGALAGSTALAQARTAGAFTTTHDAFWQAAKAAHGDAEGTRALIEVLLLHRRMPAAAVLAGMAVTLQAGSTSPDLVAIEARKAEGAAEGAEPDPPTGDTPAEPPHAGSDPTAAEDGATVLTLPVRRSLPADTRPMPSVAVYDRLLSRTSKGTA